MNPTGADRTRVLLLGMLDALLGSWWTVVVGLCLGLAGGIVVFERSERIYDAYSIVDIDANAMPTTLVTTTVPEEDGLRLRRVLRRVLDSEELETRIRSLAESSNDPGVHQDLVMRTRTRTSLAFFTLNRPLEIHFFDADPVIAAGVANVVTKLFVDMTAEARSGTARENVETLQRLADEAKQDLLEHQGLISVYRSQHIQELPERMIEIQSSLAQARAQLEANLGSQETFRLRIQTLEAQTATGVGTPAGTPPAGGSAGDGTVTGTRAGTELASLYATREELLRRYQRTHPEVVRIQALIDELEAAAASRPGAAEPVVPEEPADAPAGFGVWDIQLRAAQAKLRKLESDERALREDIAKLEARQRNVPIVQQELDRLSFGLTAKQREFDQLESKLLTAKSGERLENIESDRRFTILALAPVPAVPTSPKPLALLGGGCTIGLALFVGPLLARRYLAPRIGSEAAIRALVEVPVLARIPSIPTDGTRRRRRQRILRNIGLSVSGVAVLAAVLALRFMDFL